MQKTAPSDCFARSQGKWNFVGRTNFDKSFFRKELYLPDSGDLLEWDEMLLLDYYRANRRVLI